MFLIEHGLFLFTFLDILDIMFHMIGKILCKIGMHRWVIKTEWIPSLYADIVTRFLQIATCRRCGLKQVLVDDHYDPKTGEPV